MAGKTQMQKADALYRNSYHSIAGVDIKAVFFGKSFGNLQAISYSITREKAPIYTVGSPEPRGFARGKRGIAGSLVMVMFDDHALLSAIEEVTTAKTPNNNVYKFVTDKDEIRPFPENQELDDRVASSIVSKNINGVDFALNVENVTGNTLEENWASATPWYTDQIPAFNIVLTGVNEDGFAASMAILGVEILNEGYGISIDDLISEQQMTYVCRAISRWKKISANFGNFPLGAGSEIGKAALAALS